jgi:TfoX/Sxy family transcriptional regulator of competence genes
MARGADDGETRTATALTSGRKARRSFNLGPVPEPGEYLAQRRRTIARVAYDEDLADRIRELLSEQRGMTEKKMFGGLAFLIGGKMAIAASGQGGALVRVDPGDADHLIDTTRAEAAVMRGRPMQGWLRLESQDLRTKRQLERWVKLGVSYASSLEPKKVKKR